LLSSSPCNSSLAHSGWRLITTAEAVVGRSIVSLRQARHPLKPRDQAQGNNSPIDVTTTSGRVQPSETWRQVSCSRPSAGRCLSTSWQISASVVRVITDGIFRGRGSFCDQFSALARIAKRHLLLMRVATRDDVSLVRNRPPSARQWPLIGPKPIDSRKENPTSDRDWNRRRRFSRSRCALH
jgi:hypothetical protein